MDASTPQKYTSTEPEINKKKQEALLFVSPTGIFPLVQKKT